MGDVDAIMAAKVDLVASNASYDCATYVAFCGKARR